MTLNDRFGVAALICECSEDCAHARIHYNKAREEFIKEPDDLRKWHLLALARKAYEPRLHRAVRRIVRRSMEGNVSHIDVPADSIGGYR